VGLIQKLMDEGNAYKMLWKTTLLDTAYEVIWVKNTVELIIIDKSWENIFPEN
jgi:hypothetical protein